MAKHDQLLGHSNLMFCFTSRIARKSDPVGRSIFVNVLYEYHKSLPTLSKSEPSVVAGNHVGDTSTTLLSVSLFLH